MTTTMMRAGMAVAAMSVALGGFTSATGCRLHQVDDGGDASVSGQSDAAGQGPGPTVDPNPGPALADAAA